MDDFYSDLTYGKRGEKMIADALMARGNEVIDTSDNWYYREKDIDFRVITRSGKEITIEVKSDKASQITGNFFIENYNSNNEKHNYNGWFYYCEATHICFTQPENHKAYIVRFAELKQDIENNRYRTARGYNATGFLVPISAVEQYSTCKVLTI